MILVDQISELQVEFDKVSQGQSNVVAISNLDMVYQDISPVLKKLEVNATHREICRHLPAELSLITLGDEEVEESRKSLAAIAAFSAAWDELENKYEIGQQDVCRNTHDTIENLNGLLDANIKSIYNRWRLQVLDDISVSDSDLDKQDISPNLKNNAAEYRNLYQRLQDALDIADLTVVAIDNIEALKKDILVTLDKMEFTQPADVVALFQHLKQIGNNGRAPLSLLTDEVLEWMKEEGQEDYFYVGDKRVR